MHLEYLQGSNGGICISIPNIRCKHPRLVITWMTIGKISPKYNWSVMSMEATDAGYKRKETTSVYTLSHLGPRQAPSSSIIPTQTRRGYSVCYLLNWWARGAISIVLDLGIPTWAATQHRLYIIQNWTRACIYIE